MRYPEPRFIRRLVKRQRAAKQVERARAARDAKFGAADPRQDDRREKERRSESLSGPELDRRLRELGITDRRRGGRRTGGDRRR